MNFWFRKITLQKNLESRDGRELDDDDDDWIEVNA